MSPLWVVERGVKRRKPGKKAKMKLGLRRRKPAECDALSTQEGGGSRRSGGSQMLRGSQVSPSPMCDVEESLHGLRESSGTKVTG